MVGKFMQLHNQMCPGMVLSDCFRPEAYPVRKKWEKKKQIMLKQSTDFFVCFKKANGIM